VKSDSPEILFNAGLLEQKASNHQQAAAYYSKAAELRPNFAEAHLNLAVAQQALGKDDEAVACFEKALELKPQLAKGYFALKPLRPASRKK
jgi:tetratricopeptide (TPR) repeat protein